MRKLRLTKEDRMLPHKPSSKSKNLNLIFLIPGTKSSSLSRVFFPVLLMSLGLIALMDLNKKLPLSVKTLMFINNKNSF